MNDLEFNTLVQKKGEIDASKSILFINNCPKPKLVLVYSSQRNDKEILNYFQYLQQNLKIPFVGVRVTGTITPKEGYQENAVALLVLSGDFEVNTFQEKIDFKNPEKTAEKINEKIGNPQICFIYGANYIRDLSVMDAVLRRVQIKNNEMQIFGGTACPKPFAASNQGTDTEIIVCATINKLNFSFQMHSGFTINEENPEEFRVTKSDEYCIQEINHKNALEEYSKIQHTQPYFLNMLGKLLTKPDMAKISKKLAEINPTLYGGVIKFCVELFGSETEDKTIEPMAVFEISEDKKGIITSCYRPENSILKKLTYSKKTQLQVYDKIIKDAENAQFLLINPCAYTPFWFDFAYNEIHKKLKKTKTPYILYFSCGEYGTKTPHNQPQKNIVHGCNIEVLNILK